MTRQLAFTGILFVILWLSFDYRMNELYNRVDYLEQCCEKQCNINDKIMELLFRKHK